MFPEFRDESETVIFNPTKASLIKTMVKLGSEEQTREVHVFMHLDKKGKQNDNELQLKMPFRTKK